MASKRAQRRKACGHKVRHATTEAAMQAIKEVTRKHGWQGCMVPYRCAFCNGYHIGHPPRHVRQAMAARGR